MTAAEILEELKSLGADSYKKVIMNHGVEEPCFGVKIEFLKKIQKQVKKNYQLALDLYDTGVYDAMYLAGLIADDMKMTRADLKRWVERAYCYPLREYTVSWVAAEGKHGFEMAREWIASKKEEVASTGWATLSHLVALKPDAELDLDYLKSRINDVCKTIHDQPNRVRYTMNGFLIAVATYVRALTDLALTTAEGIGPVRVDARGTACKVPSAPESIAKALHKGGGKKKKTVKC